MARIETDPNYTSPTFSRATAGTDPFKKEDVQNLAAAVSTHDHSSGKGLPLAAGSIPTGSITSAMIADGTIQGADIATGTITTTQIADGTIATADLANASVTNVKLASDTARANLLTNGGFEIWQRTGPFSTSGAYTADRWFLGLAGSDTMTVSKESSITDASPASAKCVFTLSGGAGGSSLTQWGLKKADGYQLAGKTISVSIRVQVGTATAARAGVNTDGSGGTATYSSYHTGGGGWETLTVTVAVPSDATYVRPGVYFAASCTAYLDNAMLVVGSQAADYAPLHPADDLARCLRYYQRWQPGGAGQFVGWGWSYGTSNCWVFVPLLARAAVTPSYTVSAVGDWGVSSGSGGGVASSAITVGSFPAGTGPLGLQVTATGQTANAGAGLQALNSNAWYALEANP